MQEQMNFGAEYVSEQDIIRRYHISLGKKGGSVSTPAKAAAARRNAKLATAARILNAKRKKQGGI